MHQPRPGLGLGFMIAVCFSIDLARQVSLAFIQKLLYVSFSIVF